MKKFTLIFLLFFLNILFLNAQRNWSVKSEDDLVKARNYIGLEEGRDSVIVKTQQQSFRFSNHYPLSEILPANEIDASFTIRSIKKLNDKVYLLTGIGGNLEFETELSLIFINQNKILKYIVVKSCDKRLREIEFYYDEKNNELIFPRWFVIIQVNVFSYVIYYLKEKINSSYCKNSKHDGIKNYHIISLPLIKSD